MRDISFTPDGLVNITEFLDSHGSQIFDEARMNLVWSASSVSFHVFDGRQNFTLSDGVKVFFGGRKVSNDLVGSWFSEPVHFADFQFAGALVEANKSIGLLGVICAWFVVVLLWMMILLSLFL